MELIEYDQKLQLLNPFEDILSTYTIDDADDEGSLNWALFGFIMDDW